MKKVVLLLALGAATMAAAPPKKADKTAADKARCGYTIQQANAAAGHAEPRSRSDMQPGMIRAVERKLDGCPVLVSTSGRVMAPPAYSDGPARLAPAR
ncbi:MAG: hypothetical protein K0R64_2785 [Novosphingobium lindaniclasticum]|jgi:hypothetical protein|uniref:hypothetical protein n=1 Tax=Novosphingobium lindaniclasticum TaxID=1329895 RepID=UPI00240A714A|nr:hypothetical protein [Novosphingobium lindaniclasticum]MDF2639801.1 hypothetical protein [Novosphingobium lindaniclasticum]